MYRWFAIPHSFFSDSISSGDKALDHRQTLRELLVLIGEVDRRQRKGVPRPQDTDAHICALLDVESLLVGQNFSFRRLEIDLTIHRPEIPPSVQSLLGRTWLTFEEIQALLLQKSLSGRYWAPAAHCLAMRWIRSQTGLPRKALLIPRRPAIALA